MTLDRSAKEGGTTASHRFWVGDFKWTFIRKGKKNNRPLSICVPVFVIIGWVSHWFIALWATHLNMCASAPGNTRKLLVMGHSPFGDFVAFYITHPQSRFTKRSQHKVETSRNHLMLTDLQGKVMPTPSLTICTKKTFPCLFPPQNDTSLLPGPKHLCSSWSSGIAFERALNKNHYDEAFRSRVGLALFPHSAGVVAHWRHPVFT